MDAKNRLRHVGILIETDDLWGRSIVEAVCRYGRAHNWRVLIGPRDSQDRLRLPKVWKGDGIIASLRTEASVRHVQRTGLPVVDVGIMFPAFPGMARVATDDSARGQMAFDHLRSRGVKHFACYAPPIGRYSDVRSAAFADAVRNGGFECSIYQPTKDEPEGWLTNYSTVRRWLSNLPRPLGVFAADPYPARQLIEICALDSIRIPDEVAVLSGDDDELLCHIASPEISAIQLACRQIGERASEVLTQMISGKTVKPNPILIPPLRVIERQSTDTLCVSDPDLAEILRYMKRHAVSGLTVGDLLKKFPISRRSLEQHFRSALDRSPAEEIRRIRMEYVSRLLLETERPISSIAAEVGFASGASLSHAFSEYKGLTPGQFRQDNRGC